jgi:hypothetical protein
VIYLCRAEILSNDPNPHTVWCSTYYPYYWQKTYYPDHFVIHLDEPIKMDIKVRGKITLRFSDGREIVIKTGDE